MLIKKIPDTSGIMTTTVLNTKISEVENKLTSFNRRPTSNKTKHLEVQKKLNSLITKDHNFFLGRTIVIRTRNTLQAGPFSFVPSHKLEI